jgi:hypothetical protein
MPKKGCHKLEEQGYRKEKEDAKKHGGFGEIA